MKRSIWLVMAIVLSGSAMADENRAAYGDQTHAWLDLQKSPQDKAPPRGLPGEAADRVYQRYLQSFTRQIPERFERERANQESQR